MTAKEQIAAEIAALEGEIGRLITPLRESSAVRTQIGGDSYQLLGQVHALGKNVHGTVSREKETASLLQASKGAESSRPPRPSRSLWEDTADNPERLFLLQASKGAESSRPSRSPWEDTADNTCSDGLPLNYNDTDGLLNMNNVIGLPTTLTLQPSPQTQLTIPPVKLGRYDGTSSWEGFLAQFQLVADVSGWAENQQVLHLAAALEGEARRALLDLGRGSISLEALTTALGQRFGDSQSLISLRDQLHSRKRQTQEKLGILAADVRRLVNQAYADLPLSATRCLALDYFLRSLQPPRLRQQVRLARPTTIEEALRTAEEVEAVLAEEGTTTAPLVPRHQVRSLQESEEESPRPVRAARAEGPLLCWGCGQPGHLRRECGQARGRPDRRRQRPPYQRNQENPAQPPVQGTPQSGNEPGSA